MPKNINSITIIFTLKGIEKIKTEKTNLTKKTASVYNMNAFYFPKMEIQYRAKLAKSYKFFPCEFQCVEL